MTSGSQTCPQCDGYGTVLNTTVVSIIHNMTRTIEDKRKQMDEYFKTFPDEHVLDKCNWCAGKGSVLIRS